jgi:hypothetical protein
VPTEHPLRLRAIRGTVIQPTGPESFLARASISSAPAHDLELEHVRVLAAFTHPRTIAQAALDLDDELDSEEVGALVNDLLNHGLLVFEGVGSGIAGGFARVSSHLPMVADQTRVGAYAAAIRAQAPGRRVAELGAGSGVLTILAAKAGALSVWAVEETDIVDMAAELVAANGVADRVELVRGSSLDHTPPEPVDVLIHEIFGTDPFEEGVMQAIFDARDRWLVPGGRLLPPGFTTMACAVGGPNWERGPAQRRRVEAVADEWDLNLDALLAATTPVQRRPQGSVDTPTPEELLAGPGALFEMDLHADPDTQRISRARLTGRPGVVHAILVWFRIGFDETAPLENSPWTPLTTWGWLVYDLDRSVELRPGQDLELELVVTTFEGEEQLEIASATAVPAAV